MALPSTFVLVQKRAPWLLPADEPDVEIELVKQQYLLQPYTLLADADVENMAKYNTLQKLLLAELVAYQVVLGWATGAAGGRAGVDPGNRVVKKTKADVVEIEFESLKASDGGLLTVSLSDLLGKILADACALARQLSYQLGICGALNSYEFTPGPFLIAGDCAPAPTYNYGGPGSCCW